VSSWRDAARRSASQVTCSTIPITSHLRTGRGLRPLLRAGSRATQALAVHLLIDPKPLVWTFRCRLLLDVHTGRLRAGRSAQNWIPRSEVPPLRGKEITRIDTVRIAPSNLLPCLTPVGTAYEQTSCRNRAAPWLDERALKEAQDKGDRDRIGPNRVSIGCSATRTTS
jgi:hypothetical protein